MISVKDHRPSEARTMHCVSSPSALGNLTGAARSGLCAFKNPTGVFVLEWAMIPMNWEDVSTEIMSKDVLRSAIVKSGCKRPLHRKCVTVPMVLGSGGEYEAT